MHASGNAKRTSNVMSLRRCPGCHNTVERASIICPVCGRTWGEIMRARAIRWTVILLLVAVVAYEVVRHKRHATHVSASVGRAAWSGGIATSAKRAVQTRAVALPHISMANAILVFLRTLE